MTASWRTATVIELCQGIREAQDYSACPILADALQDADYPNADVLAILRDLNAARGERERALALVYSAESAEAVEWLEWYAEQLGHGGYPGGHGVMTYSMLMVAARSFADTGSDELGNGSMNWSNATCDPEYNQFWSKWALVAGRTPPEDDEFFFACFC